MSKILNQVHEKIVSRVRVDLWKINYTPNHQLLRRLKQDQMQITVRLR